MESPAPGADALSSGQQTRWCSASRSYHSSAYANRPAERQCIGSSGIAQACSFAHFAGFDLPRARAWNLRPATRPGAASGADASSAMLARKKGRLTDGGIQAMAIEGKAASCRSQDQGPLNPSAPRVVPSPSNAGGFSSPPSCSGQAASHPAVSGQFAVGLCVRARTRAWLLRHFRLAHLPTSLALICPGLVCGISGSGGRRLIH